MPNPVVHFEVVGSDGGKLREFYTKSFGWQFNVMPEMDYGLVDNGGAGINGGIGTSPNGAMATFYVEVADPQGALDKIESLGGKTTMPVMEIPNVVTIAMFTDPEGNPVGLVKSNPGQEMPPSNAPAAANPVTWFEINGKDANKLREFYTQAFGWPINLMEDYGMVDNQGQGIGGGIGGGDKPHAIFYVEVADPQAAMDKVTASGGTVETPVQNGGMVTFGVFNDPEGNAVGIYKMNQ